MTRTDQAGPSAGRRPRGGPAGFAAAVACAAVVSTALSAVIAAVAHGAGASRSFRALDLVTYTPFIVVGLLAAAVAWTTIRSRASDPRRLLTWLAPTVVVVSFVPDLLVGATGSLTGSSWGAVIALMCMHVVVAVSGIASFRVFLPLVGRPVRAPVAAVGVAPEHG